MVKPTNSPVTAQPDTMRYQYNEIPYNQPWYRGRDRIGLMRFRHPRDPYDRWWFIDRGNDGRVCFGGKWFHTARFFQNGFAAVTKDDSVYHLTTRGTAAYPWRFIDIGDVGRNGIARVLHRYNPGEWVFFDVLGRDFLDPTDCPIR